MTNATATATKAPIIAADIAKDADGYYSLTLACAAIGETLTIRGTDLDADINRYAACHGLKQKLVDAAAKPRDTSNGRPATPQEKWDAIIDVYNTLRAGFWNKPRAEGSGSGGGLLFAALCRLQPDRDAAAIREWLGKKTDAEKTALRANAKVAAAIEAIRQETGKSANVDTDALLGEIGV